MSAFMVLVEQAVRPVVAGPRRKLRMREELLAHLEGVYADELARRSDPTAAEAETVRRFGDPATLTAELQQSVSFRERFDAHLHSLFGWHPGRSTVSYAARMAGLVTILIIGWFAVALLATQLRREANPTVPSAGQLLWLFGSLLAFIPLGLFALVSLAVRIRASLFGAFGVTRSWRRVTALAAVAGLVVPAAGAGFYLLGVPDAGEMLFAFTPLSVGGALVGYLLVPMFIVWLALKSGPDAIRQAEWAALDLGQ